MLQRIAAKPLMSCKVTIEGDRFEREEPAVLFRLGATSSYNGATYWQPMANGENSLSYCGYRKIRSGSESMGSPDCL